MKPILYTLLGSAITLLICLTICRPKITPQIAPKQAEAREDYQRGMSRIVERDTLYLTRIQTAEVFKERIEKAPVDSVLPLRLDSCIQVGAIVLKELESANLAAQDFEMAYLKSDSLVTELAGHLDAVNREVVIQRRLKWVGIGVGLVVGFALGR
jgi:hypothetical protein